MIKLKHETKDGFCIFLNKSLLIEIDNDLKMDIDIQITLHQKDDMTYGAEYDVAEYHNIFFKGKPVDNSYKKLSEWIINYDNLMQVDLRAEINKFLDSYFDKYEQDPLLLTEEYNIKL
jgi:hypothetical protein